MMPLISQCHILFRVTNKQVAEERLEDSWVPLDETVDPSQLEEMIRSKEAHANAVILESVSLRI
jgi:peptidyl-prolyl cis-trans isomerase-like 4